MKLSIRFLVPSRSVRYNERRVSSWEIMNEWFAGNTDWCLLIPIQSGGFFLSLPSGPSSQVVKINCCKVLQASSGQRILKRLSYHQKLCWIKSAETEGQVLFTCLPSQSSFERPSKKRWLPLSSTWNQLSLGCGSALNTFQKVLPPASPLHACTRWVYL